ncbi:MAG TPA: DUF6807 family protein, partial [Pirellulales bacterium]
MPACQSTRSIVRQTAVTAWCLLVLLLASARADQTIKFQVDAGDHDRVNTPIRFSIAVPSALKDAQLATVQDDAGNNLVGQLTAPSLLAKPSEAPAGSLDRELHFILPELKAGQSKTFTATLSASPASAASAQSFRWSDNAGDYDDLLFGDRPVLRYMYHKLDESSDEARMATFKPYHHVFDPETGTQLLTKGPEGTHLDWPHHHGVFYGFREVTYDGEKKCDIWHCPAAYQEHAAFLSAEAGPVLGRQLVEINWIAEPSRNDTLNHHPATADAANATFAKEKREMTAYNVPGGTLLEFASRLNAMLPPVHLDGDPQHSGFHFRANNEVMQSTKNQTYFLRPDGKGPLAVHEGKGNTGDETRNWDPKSKTPDPRTINMPWDAMSVVIGGKRYTIAYLDNERNPKESRGSEREYGRIG